MKWFWIILGLLAALTAYFLLWGGKHDDRMPVEHNAQVSAPPRDTVAVQAPVAKADAPVVAVPPPVESTMELTPASVEPPPPPSDASAQAAVLVTDLQSSYEQRSNVEKDEAAAEAPSAPTEESEDAPESSPSHHGATTLQVEYRDDGSMLLDGQFVVRGAGTEKSPYRIPWNLLVSAQETYAPRQDLIEIPERLSFLNGKYVQVSGYVFATVFRPDADELMILRNMWDGCCIGIPPTPYDSVEVTLRKTVSTTDVSLDSIGVLRGRLRIDPYLRGNWLLGLYVIEDGTVEFIDDL